jgi:hypothetical protein
MLRTGGCQCESRGDRLDRGREPHVEGKGIAPVAAEAVGGGLALLVLDEAEVGPGGKEAKLDAHVRVRGDKDDEHVRDEQIDARQDLDLELEEAREELDLVLGDELREGDEEADLEARQAVDGRSVPAGGRASCQASVQAATSGAGAQADAHRLDVVEEEVDDP